MSDVREGAIRRVMAEIHGWLGLLAGWLLFAMFLTGTASYVRPEITRWMQPERSSVAVTPARAATVAATTLDRTAAGADRWTIFLPTDRDPQIRAFARQPGSEVKPRPVMLDSVTGVPTAARDTEGGELFYQFHYSFGLPGGWGKWLAGVCAMAMLTAIVSGVITHKRIFTDFFTMRWGKGQRSWLDAHNLVAVIGLPYHAIITYSGLVTVATLLLPAPIAAGYGSPSAYTAAAYADGPTAVRTGRPAMPVPIAVLVEDAERRWNRVPASSVSIQFPGDQASIVTVTARSGNGLAARGPSISYDAPTGRMIALSGSDGAGLRAFKAIFGLHLALFAGPTMRLLLVLLGLSGAVMVASGLVLWTTKRARSPARSGQRLAQRLNVATIACLPAAMAAYLLANRVIPASAHGRAAGEVATFYGVWVGLALAGWLRPVRSAWIESLAIAATLSCAVPIADVVRVGLPRTALFAVFDGTLFLIAGLLLLAAVQVARLLTPQRVSAGGSSVHVG